MLVFPNAEKTIRAYLLPDLRKRFGDQVKVSTEIPSGTDWLSGKPWLVVLTITGTGARRSQVFEEILIGYHGYAPTRDEAHDLIACTRALLEDWPNRSNMVAGCRPNSRPSDATDSTRYPAYYGSSSLLLKATEA